jgi:hypothetical protein
MGVKMIPNFKIPDEAARNCCFTMVDDAQQNVLGGLRCEFATCHVDVYEWSEVIVHE